MHMASSKIEDTTPEQELKNLWQKLWEEPKEATTWNGADRDGKSNMLGIICFKYNETIASKDSEGEGGMGSG